MLRVFINEGTKDNYSSDTFVCDALTFTDTGVKPKPDYGVTPYEDIDRIESFDPETDPLGHYWTWFCFVRDDGVHVKRIAAHTERDAIDAAWRLFKELTDEQRAKTLECGVYYGGDDARPCSEAGFGIELMTRIVWNW